MIPELMLYGILVSAFLMVMAKRMTALLQAFRLQSFFLFSFTFYYAVRANHLELYIVSAFILLLKVIAVPFVIERIIKRIQAEEDLGLIVNPQVSLLCALLLTYLAFLFARLVVPQGQAAMTSAFV